MSDVSLTGMIIVLIAGTILFRQYFWYALGIIVAGFTLLMAVISAENIGAAMITLIVAVVLIGSLAMADRYGRDMVARNNVVKSIPRNATEIMEIRQENDRRNTEWNPRSARTAPIIRPDKHK